jgi:hypothetical protein
MSPSKPVGLGDLMAIDAEARAVAGTVVAHCAA